MNRQSWNITSYIRTGNGADVLACVMPKLHLVRVTDQVNSRGDGGELSG